MTNFILVRIEHKNTPNEKQTWVYDGKTFTFWAGKSGFTWKCEGDITKDLFNRFLCKWIDTLSDLVGRYGAHSPNTSFTELTV